MDLIKKLYEKENYKSGLLAVEKIGLAYNAVTMVLLFVMFGRMHNPSEIIVNRCLIVALTAAACLLYKLRPCRLTVLARVLAQMGLLAYWYPETYEFNRSMPNLDHLFAQAEQWLCGCQPSLLFCKALSGTFWSELMNFGYVSYFPMIATITLAFYFFKYSEFKRATFVIMGCFFIYYLVYIFLPVTGPQFYFKAIGLGNAAHGHFNNIGTYFNNHSEMLPSPGNPHGIFYQLVEDSHNAGERPTAAFPSSHVGMSTVLLILAFRNFRRLFWCLLPVFVVLCFSTVYIQAHYFIDVIGGFVSAFIFYYVSCRLYACLSRRSADRAPRRRARS